jgi:hypothetical protein
MQQNVIMACLDGSGSHISIKMQALEIVSEGQPLQCAIIVML